MGVAKIYVISFVNVCSLLCSFVWVCSLSCRMCFLLMLRWFLSFWSVGGSFVIRCFFMIICSCLLSLLIVVWMV